MNKLTRVATFGFATALVLAITLSGPVHAANLTWNVAGDGVWDTTTPNWTGDATTYTDGDNVTFDNAVDGDPDTVITVAGMSPASTTVNAAANTTYIFVSEVPTVSGADSILAGTLVKDGPGTLQLGATDLPQPWNGANYYNNFSSVTINAGTIKYGDTDAFGTATVTLAGGTVFSAAGPGGGAEGRYKFGNEDLDNPIVVSGGSVQLPLGHGTSKDIWFKNVVSGPGGFHLTGTHRAVSFSNDNTFEGGILLESNTPSYNNKVQVGSYTGLGTGTLIANQRFNDFSAGLIGVENLDGIDPDQNGVESPDGVTNPIEILADKCLNVSTNSPDKTLLLSGPISGEGILHKTRDHRWQERLSTVVIGGEASHTGGTIVTSGTLTIDGSLADATMTIDLPGLNGAENPAPPTVNGTGTITFNIDGTTTDLIQVMNGGTLDISGLNVNVNEVGAGITEDAYVLVDYGVVSEDPGVEIGAGIISGAAFAGLTAPAGYEIDYDYLGAGSKIALVASSLIGDFDLDGDVDLDDVNALTAAADLPVGLPVALSDPKYDLTGDDMINTADLDEWLSVAATNNGFGSPYLKGDANLDGDCDVFAIDGSGDAQILSSNLGTPSGAVWGDGDFNGDGDVDVFAIDGSGDAQLLSSNLGSSSDAAPDTAEAIYDAATGELTFDVGTGIAVIGIQAEGLMHEAVATDSALGAPAQNGGGILAYFSASGLPAVMANVGNVLPTGLNAEEIGFSFTPIGGESTVVAVRVVPEPSTIALLLVLGAVALCWRRRNA